MIKGGNKICPFSFKNLFAILFYRDIKKEEFMLVEFTIIPIGAGSSLGDQLAEALKIVDASGLPYKVNPMGTVVEGEWDEIMKLIKKCHRTVMKHAERAVTTISIDDRKNKHRRIEEKVKSIERRIGKTLKK
jgi:uncharacterized protein (TIGR00106 family)